MRPQKDTSGLRDELLHATQEGRLDAAVKIVEQLEHLEPDNPSWPHRRGDLYRRMGKKDAAVKAFEHAVDLYSKKGFIARAVAMAKTITQIDPRRTDALARVDNRSARAVSRQTRGGSVVHKVGDLELTELRPHVEPERGGIREIEMPEDGAPSLEIDTSPSRVTYDPSDRSAMLNRADEVIHEVPDPSDRSAEVAGAAKEKQGTAINIVVGEKEAAKQKRPMTRPATMRAPAKPAEIRGKPAEEIQVFELRVEVAPPEKDVPKRLEVAPRASSSSWFMPPQDPHAVDLQHHAPRPSVPPLSPAKDAGDDELRFEDVGSSPEIDIDFSIDEVSARVATPSEVQELAVVDPSVEKLALLPLFTLFAEAPEAAVRGLAEGADLIELQHGEPVVKRGDPATDMYAIVEGSVRVDVPGRPADDPVLLAEGDVFGESCLLENERRVADVYVHGNLVALKIPRDVLLDTVDKHPQVGDLLFQLFIRRLIGNLMQTSDLFTAFEPAIRKEIAKHFEARWATQGTVIVQEGKRSDGLYIPITGKLNVRSSTMEHPRTVGPGTVIGQKSLLSSGQSTVTVETEMDMALLRLPAAHFMRVATQYPPVLERLVEMSEEELGPGTPRFLG